MMKRASRHAKRIRRSGLTMLLLSMTAGVCCGQTVPAAQANDARIDRLLGQLTLEEKLQLIRGGVEDPAQYQGQAGYIPGVPRLGIPSLRLADGPPGVLTRVPAQAETATMGVAATFSVSDAEANGVVIGREARSLGIDVVLQPFINIDRDITFARGFNTFGEDPFLTGVMGAGEIRGIQSQRVMAQAKHFIAYDSDSFNIVVDPQTLHEMYVAPFDAAVKAGVSSIMCSYNRINGAFACGNDATLKTILRGELGFKGFVTSDWGAVHDVQFVNQGLDMEMPGVLAADSPFGAFMHSYFQTAAPNAGKPPAVDPEALAGLMGGTLPEEPQDSGAMSGMPPMDSDPKTMRDALQDGGVTQAAVTAAARRVLHEMDRFGYLDGQQKHAVTSQDIEANAAVIRKTAEDSAVLLKNERSLPLTAADLRSLALIGPGAGQVAAIGSFGERSGGLTDRQVSPLAALKKFAPEAHVAFAVDDDLTGEPIDAAMLSHQGEPGLARTDGMGVGSIDSELNFTLGNGKALPANTKVSWSGTLAVPSSGEYWIYLQSLGARALLSIDGKRAWRTGAMSGAVHGDVQQASQDGGFPTTDGLDNVRRSVALAKGPHTIEVQISGDTSNSPEQVRLSWLTPEQRLRDHRAAIDAAKNAHTAVVFLWTRGKPAFGLPGEQDRLVEEIAAVNPNTIVVLNVSQPIAMPWLNKVKAVLQMWWPGDEGGWATAGVLLGKVNPAGRLPFTWAKRLEDYPANDPAHPERSAKGVGGITTYSEGIEVGYRGFDRANVEPLFPFGYGLSYTSFEYSNLRVLPASDGGLDVSLRVRNTGKAAGDEVPQVYLEAPEKRPDGVQFAVRSLAGFERITLRQGELKAVSLHVTPRALDYWSVASNRWVRAGARRVSVGSSSRDLKLSAMVP